MDLPDLPAILLERLNQHEQLLNREAFYVLIWGSGESLPRDYGKRLKIRDYLASLFGSDKVFMSEDERFQPLVERHGLAVAEAMQAGSLDGIVILDTSIGPHSELLKYGDIIHGKAIVFAERKDKDMEGFGDIAFHTAKVERYTSEEYESCETIRRKARDFLSGLRFIKARQKDLQGLFGT